MSCPKETTLYYQVLHVWDSLALEQRRNKVHISLSCFECFSFVQGSFPMDWQGHGALLWVLADHPQGDPKALAGSCQPLSEQMPPRLHLPGGAVVLGWPLVCKPRRGNPTLPWCAGHSCGSQKEHTQQIPESSGHGLCVRSRSGFLHWPLSPSRDLGEDTKCSW